MIMAVGFLACSKKPTQSKKSPVPNLYSPTKGSTDIPSSIGLRWEGTEGAIGYGLQVSADSSFSDFFVNENSVDTTSYALTGLSPSTKYYWRVNAVYENGKSNWSSVWHFITEVGVLSAPTLSLPPNGATGITINPTLRWNKSPGAKRYILQVSTDSLFSNFVVDRHMGSINYYGLSINGLAISTLYYWRVTIANSYDSSESDIWSFTTADAIYGNWTFYNTSNSGLVSNFVYCIAVDQLDGKWFGTYSGVSKFDGSDWTTYNTSNSGLVDNLIWVNAVDKQGNKWFGTQNGLSKFDDNGWTTYNTSNSGLATNNVSEIAIDSVGNKWFCGGSFISKFDGENWTIDTLTGSWIPNGVTAIAVDALGSVWIALINGGVSKIEGTGWIHYGTYNSGILGGIFKSIAFDKSGNIWFGNYNWGVSKFDGTNWTTYNTSNSGLLTNEVYAIAVDQSDNIWFGTKGGISKFDGVNWAVDTSIVSYDIVVDAAENKWFSIQGGVGGVAMLQE